MPFSQNLQKIEKSNQNEMGTILQVGAFLSSVGIKNYRIDEIPNDCSRRRYYRIFSKNQRFILMDARQEKAAIRPFVKVGTYLFRLGLSVPEIYQVDEENGFVLMEDLGDALLTKVLAQRPELERELYDLAVDVLVTIHQNGVDGDYPEHDAIILNRGLEVFCKYFLKQRIPADSFALARKELTGIFSQLYQYVGRTKKVLVHRDYMADNLLYLPERQKIAKIGILDFQDAHIGSPAYDLVSLLEDARRKVSLSVIDRSIERYLKAMPGINHTDFNNSYVILGMQRNLRIVGVFHRMNILYNKPQYLGYLPKVFGYIKAGLQESILASVKEWFEKYKVFSYHD